MTDATPFAEDSRSFEAIARRYFSKYFGTDLLARRVMVAGSVGKSFDLVSEDGKIVGDAKWYSAIAVPAAKWSTIAEYVWMLQKTNADRAFIVFGNDPSVPERWLKRFRILVDPVEFYFLDGAGHRRL